MSRYPRNDNYHRKPEIGLWWAPCCELDLQQVVNEADLVEALNFWNHGPYAGAWCSKEEALEDLTDA